MGKQDIDHRADQLNPNNDAFWTSRGWDERPDDWEDRVERDDAPKDSSQKSDSQYGRQVVQYLALGQYED